MRFTFSCKYLHMWKHSHDEKNRSNEFSEAIRINALKIKIKQNIHANLDIHPINDIKCSNRCIVYCFFRRLFSLQSKAVSVLKFLENVI